MLSAAVHVFAPLGELVRRIADMFEGVPVEGLIGIGAFIGSIILLALIHGVSAAVQNAQASRREAAKLVTHLSNMVSAADGKNSGPKGPGPAGSPRPVRRRRVVSAQKSAARPADRTSYGPRSMAGR
jgi:hypothetical protein